MNNNWIMKIERKIVRRNFLLRDGVNNKQENKNYASSKNYATLSKTSIIL